MLVIRFARLLARATALKLLFDDWVSSDDPPQAELATETSAMLTSLIERCATGAKLRATISDGLLTGDRVWIATNDVLVAEENSVSQTLAEVEGLWFD